MSKRTSGGAGKGGNTKRPRQLTTLVTDWEQSINSADIAGCKEIKANLESLLNTAKDRIATLEEDTEKQGLKYEGEDELECGCGNTVESGGDYAATCDECPDETKEEQCTECVKECSGDCGKHLCGDCKKTCSGCSETFCEDCLITCCSCHEGFCDRGKDCSLLDVGYAGESSCRYCLER